MTIKNVVFDIGNVLVKWAPNDVISKIFPQVDPEKFFQKIHPVWIDLNLGKLTEVQAIEIYVDKGFGSKEKITKLINEFKVSQIPLPGSFELVKKLFEKGISLYSITDNVKEIIEFYKTNYDFLIYFKGVVVSAEIGIMKPSNEIYQHLLINYNLKPQECVFIDDLLKNVEGAIAVGMHAFQFTDALACEAKLIELGVLVDESNY